MEECYPDTIEVDSSNLSVITIVRLNSTEEDHHYKVIVVGSNPAVATRLVRNSIGSEYRSFTPGVQGSSPCGPTMDE